MSRISKRLSLAAAAILLTPGLHAEEVEFGSESETTAGEIIFKSYCVSCHGLKAKGDGPAAAALKKKPADLTQIRKRRDGEFYFVEIAEIIDGRTQIDAHGSRTMPIWGKRFGETIGDHPVKEELISGNLLSLVLYLKSIQE